MAIEARNEDTDSLPPPSFGNYHSLSDVARGMALDDLSVFTKVALEIDALLDSNERYGNSDYNIVNEFRDAVIASGALTGLGLVPGLEGLIDYLTVLGDRDLLLQLFRWQAAIWMLHKVHRAATVESLLRLLEVYANEDEVAQETIGNLRILFGVP